jgi:hypothetical protein
MFYFFFHCHNFIFIFQGIKKFDYCLPQPKTPSTSTTAALDEHKKLNKKDFDKSCHDDKPLISPVYFATCSPRKNKNLNKKRHYNVSPDGVSSLDEYTTMITYDAPCGNARRMSITISDGNSSSEISTEPIMMESIETSSLITQSTRTTNTSPLPSPSSSGISMMTSATLESKQSQNRPKNLCDKIGEEDDGEIVISSSQENIAADLYRGRRHAINITNNPGYRVSRSALPSDTN